MKQDLQYATHAPEHVERWEAHVQTADTWKGCKQSPKPYTKMGNHHVNQLSRTYRMDQPDGTACGWGGGMQEDTDSTDS